MFGSDFGQVRNRAELEMTLRFSGGLRLGTARDTPYSDRPYRKGKVFPCPDVVSGGLLRRIVDMCAVVKVCPS